jgi:hypothetical protein
VLNYVIIKHVKQLTLLLLACTAWYCLRGVINEVAEEKGCSSVLFFEARKRQDLYLWMVSSSSSSSDESSNSNSNSRIGDRTCAYGW